MFIFLFKRKTLHRKQGGLNFPLEIRGCEVSEINVKLKNFDEVIYEKM